jgi:hypothetical protein
VSDLGLSVIRREVVADDRRRHHERHDRDHDREDERGDECRRGRRLPLLDDVPEARDPAPEPAAAAAVLGRHGV